MKRLYENIEDIDIAGSPENLTELITDIDDEGYLTTQIERVQV